MIGGVNEYLNNDNAVITSVKEGLRDDLVASVTRKGGEDSGDFHIKLKDGVQIEGVFKRILISKSILGKTINEFRDTKFENL